VLQYVAVCVCSKEYLECFDSENESQVRTRPEWDFLFSSFLNHGTRFFFFLGLYASPPLLVTNENAS